jgi:hypothetical protein
MRRAYSRSILVLTAGAMLVSVVAIAGPAIAKGPGGKSSSACAVSPNPVASGANLTVSGKAGHSGNWVNVYIYYSDGTWNFIGGSVGGGGTFSLSGSAVATTASLWGPFVPATTGPATAKVYAGSASRDLGMVSTCSFSVS